MLRSAIGALLLLAACVSATEDGPTNWVQGIGGFSNFEYIYISKYESWTVAHARCQTYYAGTGSFLVSIHSQEEQDWIYESLVAPNFGQRDLEQYWIGGFRVGTTEFAWSDGTPFDFQFFLDGEPNNYDGKEDCLRVGHRQIDSSRWNDAKCNNRKPYVCKRPIATTTTPFTGTTTTAPSTTPNTASTSAGSSSTMSSSSTSSTASTTTVATTTTVPTTTTPVFNPVGWTPFYDAALDRVCYYREFTTRLDWATALSSCRALGPAGDLASVHSNELNIFLSKLGINSRHPRWLGGQVDVFGAITWSDGTAHDYDHWFDGEPNSFMEQCVSQGHTKKRDATRWNDANCDLKQRYLCQYCPPGATLPTVATVQPSVPTSDPPSSSSSSSTSTTTRKRRRRRHRRRRRTTRP
eukprot:m.12259 g.12259  ORF g.12259 m.12259 type:complete len:409 (+) comp3216_c0_seq1:216-1442(+)